MGLVARFDYIPDSILNEEWIRWDRQMRCSENAEEISHAAARLGEVNAEIERRRTVSVEWREFWFDEGRPFQ